jgi:hypothetical protein
MSEDVDRLEGRVRALEVTVINMFASRYAAVAEGDSDAMFRFVMEITRLRTAFAHAARQESETAHVGPRPIELKKVGDSLIASIELAVGHGHRWH